MNSKWFHRLINKCLLTFQQCSMLHSKKIRPQLLRFIGVKIGHHVHIGEQIIIDSIFPENIKIGDYSTITMRCTILTHYYKPNNKERRFVAGNVNIGKRVFIGCHTIICAPVNIGDDAVIAAGSVVTKDIPSGEIWGGCPASFISKRTSFDIWDMNELEIKRYTNANIASTNVTR